MPRSVSLPPRRLSIRRKVTLGLCFVLLMLGVIAFITLKSTRSFQRAAELVAESRETLEMGEQLMRQALELETARRTYVITGEEDALPVFAQARRTIADLLGELGARVSGDGVQALRIGRLKELLGKVVDAEERELEARRSGGFEAGAAAFARSPVADWMKETRQVVFDFEHEERVQLAERSELSQLIGQATNLVTIIGTSVTFLALGSAAVLILRDIRRRRRAEEALAEQANLLSSIMDALPDHVYVKDAEGRFITHNRAHRLYLGLRAGESIDGLTVFDLFPRELAARYHADDLYVVEKGAPIRNREEPARPISANVRWLSTTKMPLRNPGGQIIGIVCASADITARVEADEKLKRFAAQLERSNAELQSFASVASHDLQEPLRKIQAFGDRLTAKCSAELGEQGRNYLARMQNAAERMQVLIQDLLKLSRVASRAQPFKKCDLAQIVTAVLGDLEVAVEERGARVDVAELPTIDADPLQMRQLFQNLIANALKFCAPERPPIVTITSELRTAETDELPHAPRGSAICVITLQDNGIGFEQKFADQIFVVFQRLHTRQEYEGTGIGLAVCRKITDRHGGAIVAKSAPGEGATFLITLPVKQPSPDVEADEKRDHADHNPDGG